MFLTVRFALLGGPGCLIRTGRLLRKAVEILTKI
jgi:hypothetical protein